jgi:hypothetical protein
MPVVREVVRAAGHDYSLNLNNSLNSESASGVSYDPTLITHDRGIVLGKCAEVEKPT